MKYTIAIGGPIGVGKTTFCKRLKEKEPNITIIREIPDDPNHLINQFLKEMYLNKNRTENEKNYSAFAFQTYMLGYRSNELAKDYTGIRYFDRCILEDRFFANKLIQCEELKELYNKLWDNLMNRLYESECLPNFYIILEPDYEGQTLESIKERGRNCELDEYELNKDYYLELEKEYTNYLVKTCEQYNIPYVVAKRSSRLVQDLDFGDLPHDSPFGI